MENKALASAILASVGGKDNIVTATNCMTRLRLKLVDKSLIDEASLAALDGVMGVVASDTLQVVVGPGRAKKIMDIFSETLDVKTDLLDWEENKQSLKSQQKETKLKHFLKTISSIFVPLIPAIIAAGLFSGFASIITQFIKPSTGFWFITRELFSLISQGFLGYFAIFTGVNAAKEFGATPAFGGMIGAMSIAPGIIKISEFFSLYNVDAPLKSVLTTGKGGIIGVILGVFLLSKIEKTVRKIVPDVLDLMVTPVITLLVSSVIFVLGIMPFAGFVSDILVSGLSMIIGSTNPIIAVIAGFVLAALFLPMVLLGLHHGLIPIYAIQFEATGGVSLFPILAMAGAGQVGAAIAIFIKAHRTHNLKLKQVITGALPAGFLGVGEPLIYGVTLPLGKAFITAGLGAGVGGAFVALMGVQAVAWGPSGLVAIPLMKTPMMMVWYVVGLLIAYIFGFIFTFIFMKERDINR